MSKPIIRKKTLSLLQNITMEDKLEREYKFYSSFMPWVFNNKFKSIALYFSIYPEVMMQPLIYTLDYLGVPIYLPRIEDNNQMNFHRFDVTSLELGKFNIYQPNPSTSSITKDQLDLMIVPGIAYMSCGSRIGYGGGYYDRFLADFPGKTVSVLFEEQLYPDNTWKPTKYDQQINKLIII